MGLVSCGAVGGTGGEISDAKEDRHAEKPLIEYRGVSYAHIHRRGSGYGSTGSLVELKALKWLGVNTVALTPFGYQPTAVDAVVRGHDGFDPDEPFRPPGRDRSLTDADLIREIDQAHSIGLKVILKPHIWASDFWSGEEWHGTVRQTTSAWTERWWNSYRAFTLHYARLARDAGAEVYCIGTELVEMTAKHPDRWRALIAEVREIAKSPPRNQTNQPAKVSASALASESAQGSQKPPAKNAQQALPEPMKLTYAAHWDREFDQIDFWDELDLIGINAYFPLDAPRSADVEDLATAWAPHKERIEKVYRKHRKPVLFTEVGYRPVTATWQEPWHYSGGEWNEQDQATAYDALFRAFAEQPWWSGALVWKAFTDPVAARNRGDGSDFLFRELIAEEVISKWYQK